MGPYLIGVDIGTLGVRSIIFNLQGKEVGQAYRELLVDTPRPGWAEQRPEIWWLAVAATIKEALKKARISLKEVAGVGLTSQQQSVVLIDKRGKPCRSSILWMDRRSSAQCKWMIEQIGEDAIYKITGLRVEPTYSASKILWIRENQPKIYDQTFKILLPKDYIGCKLTNAIYSDFSIASSTQLLDIEKKRWSAPLLEETGIAKEKLPELLPSHSVIGEITKEASVLTGLPRGTPVVSGGGDGQCTALGAGLISHGDACEMSGTATNLIVCVDDVILDPMKRVGYYCHVVPNKWVLIAPTTAGICLRWFRDNFCQEETKKAIELGVSPYEIMDEEAEKADPGSKRLIFLPYLVDARCPVWDPNARGVFFGLTLVHRKEDVIRAVLEGIAYSLRHRIEVVEEMGIKLNGIKVVGGGAKSMFWQKIRSSVLGRQIFHLRCIEAASLGAAMLAGVGVRTLKSIPEAAKKMVLVTDKEKPNKADYKLYTKLFHIYKKVTHDLKEPFRGLSMAQKEHY